MSIWGRILGTVIGAAVMGLPGALIGFLLGRLIDRQGAGAVTAGIRHSQGKASAQALFMELLFTALGRLAKSDGRVSEQEVAHTEAIMSRFGLSGEQRQQAIAWFKRGADLTYDYQPLLLEFSQATRFRPDLKKVLLESVISLALVGGTVSQQEKTVLHEIARGIGIPPQVFEQLLQLILAQARFGQAGGGAGHSAEVYNPNRLQEAYDALGVSANASDSEVKRAYRKLMSKNHPDKLMSQGVPDEAIKLATEKSQAIQQAYDLIKDARKTRSAA